MYTSLRRIPFISRAKLASFTFSTLIHQSTENSYGRLLQIALFNDNSPLLVASSPEEKISVVGPSVSSKLIEIVDEPLEGLYCIQGDHLSDERLIVNCPQRIDLNLSTSRDMVIKNKIEGDAYLQSSGGNIFVHGTLRGAEVHIEADSVHALSALEVSELTIKAKLEVSVKKLMGNNVSIVTNGNINVDSIYCPNTELKSFGMGSILVDGVHGNLRAVSNESNIEVCGVSGSVNLESNGSIYVHFDTVKDISQIHAKGDILLYIAAPADVDLDISAPKGIVLRPGLCGTFDEDMVFENEQSRRLKKLKWEKEGKVTGRLRLKENPALDSSGREKGMFDDRLGIGESTEMRKGDYQSRRGGSGKINQSFSLEGSSFFSKSPSSAGISNLSDVTSDNSSTNGKLKPNDAPNHATSCQSGDCSHPPEDQTEPHRPKIKVSSESGTVQVLCTSFMEAMSRKSTLSRYYKQQANTPDDLPPYWITRPHVMAWGEF